MGVVGVSGVGLEIEPVVAFIAAHLGVDDVVKVVQLLLAQRGIDDIVAVFILFIGLAEDVHEEFVVAGAGGNGVVHNVHHGVKQNGDEIGAGFLIGEVHAEVLVAVGGIAHGDLAEEEILQPVVGYGAGGIVFAVHVEGGGYGAVDIEARDILDDLADIVEVQVHDAEALGQDGRLFGDLGLFPGFGIDHRFGGFIVEDLIEQLIHEHDEFAGLVGGVVLVRALRRDAEIGEDHGHDGVGQRDQRRKKVDDHGDKAVGVEEVDDIGKTVEYAVDHVIAEIERVFTLEPAIHLRNDGYHHVGKDLNTVGKLLGAVLHVVHAAFFVALILVIGAVLVHGQLDAQRLKQRNQRYPVALTAGQNQQILQVAVVGYAVGFIHHIFGVAAGGLVGVEERHLTAGKQPGEDLVHGGEELRKIGAELRERDRVFGFRLGIGIFVPIIDIEAEEDIQQLRELGDRAADAVAQGGVHGVHDALVDEAVLTGEQVFEVAAKGCALFLHHELRHDPIHQIGKAGIEVGGELAAPEVGIGREVLRVAQVVDGAHGGVHQRVAGGVEHGLGFRDQLRRGAAVGADQLARFGIVLGAVDIVEVAPVGLNGPGRGKAEIAQCFDNHRDHIDDLGVGKRLDQVHNGLGVGVILLLAVHHGVGILDHGGGVAVLILNIYGVALVVRNSGTDRGLGGLLQHEIEHHGEDDGDHVGGIVHVSRVAGDGGNAGIRVFDHVIIGIGCDKLIPLKGRAGAGGGPVGVGTHFGGRIHRRGFICGADRVKAVYQRLHIEAGQLFDHVCKGVEAEILQRDTVIVVVDIDHVTGGILQRVAERIGLVEIIAFAVLRDLAVAGFAEERQHEAADELVQKAVQRGTVQAAARGAVVDIDIEYGQERIHEREYGLQQVAHSHAQAVGLQEVQEAGQHGGEQGLYKVVVYRLHHGLAVVIQNNGAVVVGLFNIFGLHDLLKEAEGHVEEVFHLQLLGRDLIELTLAQHVSAVDELVIGKAYAVGKALEIFRGEKLVHAEGLEQRNDGAIVTVGAVDLQQGGIVLLREEHAQIAGKEDIDGGHHTALGSGAACQHIGKNILEGLAVRLMAFRVGGVHKLGAVVGPDVFPVFVSVFAGFVEILFIIRVGLHGELREDVGVAGVAGDQVFEHLLLGNGFAGFGIRFAGFHVLLHDLGEEVTEGLVPLAEIHAVFGEAADDIGDKFILGGVAEGDQQTEHRGDGLVRPRKVDVAQKKFPEGIDFLLRELLLKELTDDGIGVFNEGIRLHVGPVVLIGHVQEFGDAQVLHIVLGAVLPVPGVLGGHIGGIRPHAGTGYARARLGLEDLHKAKHEVRGAGIPYAEQKLFYKGILLVIIAGDNGHKLIHEGFTLEGLADPRNDIVEHIGLIRHEVTAVICAAVALDRLGGDIRTGRMTVGRGVGGFIKLRAGKHGAHVHDGHFKIAAIFQHSFKNQRKDRVDITDIHSGD